MRVLRSILLLLLISFSVYGYSQPADDNTSTAEDTPVTLNVTSNDSHAFGIDISSVDLDITTDGIQPSYTTTEGFFEVNATGDVTFSPASNFNGTATITYSVNTQFFVSAGSANINISVVAVNDAAPIANNDASTVNEDNGTTISILANDTDVDGNATINAASVILSGQTNGTFAADASGVVTYTPPAGFNGMATAVYTVSDSDGAVSNAATITITMTSVNDGPPVANNDAATVAEDNPINITVTANDTDPDGNATINVSSIILSGQTNGTFTANALGVVTYTPPANFHGTATANYTMSDNEGAVSNAATVTVTVTSVNDGPPVANNDAATTSENTALTNLDILANDTDPDGNSTIVVSSVSLGTGTGGVWSVSAGIVSFTPTTNFNGTATNTYTVADQQGSTSTAGTITITVSSVNAAPIANSDASATINEDASLNNFDILANDTDADGNGTIDASSVVLGTGSNGTWSVNALGRVSFTPTANFNGSASNTYTVKDNEGVVSNTATITVTVAPVNDIPVANNDATTITEDGTATISILTNDTDADGNNTINPASIQLSATTNGTFTVDGAGVLTYTPPASFHGTATAQYTVQDNAGALSNAATITITVTSQNDAPSANNDSGVTNEDTPVTVNVTSNDTDADGNATINAASVVLGGGTQGTWSVSGGVVSYTPTLNFHGIATNTYTIKDNNDAVSNTATITITILPVNDAPVAVADNASTNEDVPVSINVITNDTDIENSLNGASIIITEMVGGTFSADNLGLVTFTPTIDFTGTATAKYTVKDNGGATSNVTTITIAVSDIEDAPIAANDVATTNEDVAVAINIISNDADVDGTINAATLDLDVATPATQEKTFTTAQGTFSVSPSGVLNYTPLPNFYGTATLNYTVNDNSGKKSNQATITVTVNAVNDPPKFDLITDKKVLTNSAERTITITNISSGPSESGEKILLTVTSGNTSLIPNPVVSFDGTSTTATLTFKPQPDQAGTATITVKVVDTALNEFSQSFTIEVVDVKFTSTPVAVAVFGEPYEYNISITDVESPLVISVAQKPSWLTFTANGSNARLSGTPPASALPSNTIKIQILENSAVLDEQAFELVVNHRPDIVSFDLQTNEDQSIVFQPSHFNSAYVDVDNHLLNEIQFTEIPLHGVLTFNNSVVSQNDKIPFASITALSYTPNLDYVGKDTLSWNASDGFSYSLENSFISFDILPLNDAPTIAFIESDTLDYEVGNEVAQYFTDVFDAADADGDNLMSAEIGFRRPNFNTENDVLLFTNTSKITGVYDSQIGILTLTGEASAEEYVQAIRSITYNYKNLDDLTLANRTIYITLSDGKSSSDTKERIIDLIYTFVDLDIPTAFTPNGDQANDHWKISSVKGIDQYQDAVVRVFNKHGKIVYEATGFERLWDGTMNGQLLPVDSYYYTIDLNYNKVQYKGVVTILR